MNSLKVLFGFACLMIAFNVQPVHAQVVYDRSAFDTAFPSANVENWDSYSSGTTIASGSLFNGITYNLNNGNSALVTGGYVYTSYSNTLGETNNGFFVSGDTITFSFNQPLSAFAIDINTYSTDPSAYTATLSNGDVVDSSFDPFTVTGFSTGESLDFSDPTSFDSVTIQANDGDSYTLDTLQYVNASSSSVVPEPSTVALMLFGLIGIAVVSIRRYKLTV